MTLENPHRYVAGTTPVWYWDREVFAAYFIGTLNVAILLHEMYQIYYIQWRLKNLTGTWPEQRQWDIGSFLRPISSELWKWHFWTPIWVPCSFRCVSKKQKCTSNVARLGALLGALLPSSVFLQKNALYKKCCHMPIVFLALSGVGALFSII